MDNVSKDHRSPTYACCCMRGEHAKLPYELFQRLSPPVPPLLRHSLSFSHPLRGSRSLILNIAENASAFLGLLIQLDAGRVQWAHCPEGPIPWMCPTPTARFQITSGLATNRTITVSMSALPRTRQLTSTCTSSFGISRLGRGLTGWEHQHSRAAVLLRREVGSSANYCHD